jgi:hypothetical protein
MGKMLRLLVVTSALLMAATAFGLWAAAGTTDRETVSVGGGGGGLDLPTRMPPLW